MDPRKKSAKAVRGRAAGRIKKLFEFVSDFLLLQIFELVLAFEEGA